METILKIEEAQFDTEDLLKTEANPYEGFGCDGYVITTDTQEIKLGITTGQQCCEVWGYFMSQDNPSDFVGSHLLGVSITDDKLRTHQLLDFDGVAMFVNVQTDRGLLQFVAYNEHNGYYGHMACVLSNQINHSEMI